jgi:hypothetical protein
MEYTLDNSNGHRQTKEEVHKAVVVKSLHMLR